MTNIKQAIVGMLLLAFLIPSFSYAQTSVTGIAVDTVSVDVAPEASVVSNIQLFDTDLRKGQTSDDIQALQEILATDPEIYPEGITSGYFGTLTENAIRRLQERYSLPVTGILDDVTLEVIYPPNITLTVVQPNEGEIWKKGSTHRILWRSTVSPIYYRDDEVLPAQSYDAAGDVAVIEPAFAPFFPRVSVDLVRDSNPNFQYHIGTANLYDSGIAWRIPERLPEAKDYRVRISVGKHVPCLYRLEDSVADTDLSIAPPCPWYDGVYGGRDQSDRPFTIIDEEVDPPNDEVIEKIKAQLRLMQTNLEAALRSLKEVNALLGEL